MVVPTVIRIHLPEGPAALRTVIAGKIAGPLRIRLIVGIIEIIRFGTFRRHIRSGFEFTARRTVRGTFGEIAARRTGRSPVVEIAFRTVPERTARTVARCGSAFTGLIHPKAAAGILFPVQGLDRLGGIGIIHLDETVAQRTAGVAVGLDPRTEDSAERLKQRLEFIVCGCIRQIADIHTFHNPGFLFLVPVRTFPFFETGSGNFSLLLFIRTVHTF